MWNKGATWLQIQVKVSRVPVLITRLLIRGLRRYKSIAPRVSTHSVHTTFTLFQIKKQSGQHPEQWDSKHCQILTTASVSWRLSYTGVSTSACSIQGMAHSCVLRWKVRWSPAQPYEKTSTMQEAHFCLLWWRWCIDAITASHWSGTTQWHRKGTRGKCLIKHYFCATAIFVCIASNRQVAQKRKFKHWIFRVQYLSKKVQSEILKFYSF